MGVLEHQDLRIVYGSSLQKCSPEGKSFYSPRFLYYFVHYSDHGGTVCSVRSGSWTGGDGSWVELSGKMHVLARLLAHLRQRTDDRIVLVSNYTQVGLR